jgi:flagellar motor switch protein FliN/FliY
MNEVSEASAGESMEKVSPSTASESADSARKGPAENGAAEINLDALLDVPVQLSVEIGRSKVPINQLISLSQGSVIELDRGVNEPLDLLVNGTLMARGEVVVVDGQFGLRLIDIVSPRERLKKLK